MFSVRLIMRIVLLGAWLGMAGCDGITDDLLPSGDDIRQTVEAGTSGTQVGQISPDFPVEVLDTLGQHRGLYDELSKSTGVVLYFTMWCPICETHMSHMRAEVMPQFPAVQFFLVDFVSGSVGASRAAQVSNKYEDIETLVDTNQALLNLYHASMGTTVVIDSAGNIVRMNEDYKDGVKLIETLEAL
jgi:peroxiredoxin